MLYTLLRKSKRSARKWSEERGAAYTALDYMKMNYRGFIISFLYIYFNKSGGAPRGEKNEGRLIMCRQLLPRIHTHTFFSL